MLDALRRGATSWVLKPLLLLLVLAFIVWGVADVFTGVRPSTLATVGGTEIGAEEYQNTFSSVMNNLARRFGRRPTTEEARMRGIDRAVLEDLINGAAIDQHAHELGLTLPTRTVIAQVESDPSFQGPDGKFDSRAFNSFLRDMGLSERGFLARKAREEVRQQLTHSLFDDVPVPAAMANMVHAWREETRRVQYFTVDPKTGVKLGAPDEAKLAALYEQQKSRFMRPEYRHLGALLLTTEAAKQRLEISDEDIRKAYDGDKSARVIEEKRHVRQIGFKDKTAAEAAAKAIADGKSFAAVAKDMGATDSDIDLGVVTRSQLLDPAIAEAAFALKKGEVSKPVEGRFTTVLLEVRDITPGKVRTLEEMKEEIRSKLAQSRVNDAMRKLHDAVDDGRAAGKPLKEIAAEIKVGFVDIPQTDRLGNTPDGKKAHEGADAAAILKAGFEGRVGADGEPIDLADGGYGWVDVFNVTPEQQRPFDEVKAEVVEAWQEEETARQLNDVAAKLMERAEKGEALATLAAEVGGKLATSKLFNRFAQEPGLGVPLVRRAFALGLGARASTLSGDGKSRTVFRVVEIVKPKPATKEEAERLADQIRTELQQDAGRAYVTSLRDRLGVSINETQFRRAVGGGDAQ
jgi:peptidyl-prolyl cis-trans isomerase D